MSRMVHAGPTEFRTRASLAAEEDAGARCGAPLPGSGGRLAQRGQGNSDDKLAGSLLRAQGPVPAAAGLRPQRWLWWQRAGPALAAAGPGQAARHPPAAAALVPRAAAQRQLQPARVCGAGADEGGGGDHGGRRRQHHAGGAHEWAGAGGAVRAGAGRTVLRVSPPQWPHLHDRARRRQLWQRRHQQQLTAAERSCLLRAWGLSCCSSRPPGPAPMPPAAQHSPAAHSSSRTQPACPPPHREDLIAAQHPSPAHESAESEDQAALLRGPPMRRSALPAGRRSRRPSTV